MKIFDWLREICRLPSSGGPVKFELNRGNLAYNFCSMLNLNTYFEMPRQCGKTISVLCRYLYIYTYGTINSKMAFLNKSAESSRDNLQSLKEIQECLPNYLKLMEKPKPDGSVIRGKYNTTNIVNPFNNNNIKCFAGGTTQARAASILRGKTLPLIYFDEFAFLPWNMIVYTNGAPAFNTAALNAKKSGSPYGITITSTPGFLSTDEGKEAFKMKELATPFNESFYDLTYPQLRQILDSNKKSDYVYIKFGYQELGKSEEWFNSLVKLLNNSWPDIRREVLLQWNAGVSNSPFELEDLEVIRTMVKPPISVVYLLGKYRFETYLQAETRLYPPIIGVDVSGGYKQDSSSITVIDSQTTKVLGCLNCNYISINDLSRCLEFIVKSWMPNAILSIERNGGFGAAVIANLVKAGLRKNLFYEIKDVLVEEKHDGIHAYKQKIKTKVFGINSTKDVRKQLIDLLIERVQYHKDKFLSPIIYNELIGMEVKKSGKIEHSDATHDDQVFSYLMAMYVWYYGSNLAERYGIKKSTIKTDDDIDETIEEFEPETMSIVKDLNMKTEIEEITDNTLKALDNPKAQMLKDFYDQQYEKEMSEFYKLLNTDLGQRGFKTKYNIPMNVDIQSILGNQSGFNQGLNVDKLVTSFYRDDNNPYLDPDAPELNVVPEGAAFSLQNRDGYNYNDHFNF